MGGVSGQLVKSLIEIFRKIEFLTENAIYYDELVEKYNHSDQDQVEIRKSRFEDIARSGFLDLKKSGDQEIRFS